ncbi:MAG TPA: endonuclease/exonuclease/phosphatase family protein [Leptolyngbyaceae cyanobacterium M33_DOE_097]|nr:endonuclease/exonuclease/phosphatase family protein [Leptolyngbyaceae cyanobacterium M33_DOE_097]
MKRSAFNLRSLLAWLVLGAIVGITGFAYLTSYYGWSFYLEIFSHFQAQYLGLSFILFGILVCLRRNRLVYIGLFFCILLAMQILPWYLPPQRIFQATAPTSQLRILVANLNVQNRSFDRVLNLIWAEKPNIAIFIEVDDEWREQLNQLADLLPYSSGKTNSYNLGILIYSNLSLDNTKIEFFGSDSLPSIVSQLTVQNQPITLIATHPLPPMRPQFFHSRNQQLDRIGQRVIDTKERTILAGDLNITMWSPYFRQLVSRTELKNARSGFGILPSWPDHGAYYGIPDWVAKLFLIPIDHCLISSGLQVTNIRTGASTNSDHLPLIVDLNVTDRT